MTTQLQQRIARYARWRTEMVAGIEAYKDWLDANGVADIQQSLRIYDLLENLRNDRVTLAFIAEFSRGKTELINAMLFSHYGKRVLPSDVGRTTMCPTEIFHDPSEQPCIRLLPIETRARHESIASFKPRQIEWIRIALNVASAEEMAQALRVLGETKTVDRETALELGLFDGADPEATTVIMRDPDKVQIPAWRHALVNYPHPLLSNGLVVLDTPGLNALGTEPELTMSMIPHAQAVLFLLGMDTGVTRSDLGVWSACMHQRIQLRLAVLNKVDVAWDDLRPDEEIEASIRRQVDATAATLGLPAAHVLPLSARNALIARVRKDPGLLARSGIERLESLIASEIVPAKQEILRASVVREIGGMVDASRQQIATQFIAMRDEYRGVLALSGKNRDAAQAMLAKLEEDKITYQASAERFRAAMEDVTRQGELLLAALSDDVLDELMNTDRRFIENAWTTSGLIKSMQGLFSHFLAQSTRIHRFAGEIRVLVEETYDHFHTQYGFARMTPPALELDRHESAMRTLNESTGAFCHDPVSIMTEKHFLVRRFYDSLVAEARQIFEATRSDTEAWLRGALRPLSMAVRAYEGQLNKRVESLLKLRDDVQSAEARAKQLEAQMRALKAQHEVLVKIRSGMQDPADAAAGQVPDAPAEQPSGPPAAQAA